MRYFGESVEKKCPNVEQNVNFIVEINERNGVRVECADA